MGRNLFDVIDAPSGWSDDMGYGAHHAVRPLYVDAGPTITDRAIRSARLLLLANEVAIQR